MSALAYKIEHDESDRFQIKNQMDKEVAEARAKLAARFGKVQIGGKGTQRRAQKKTPHSAQAAVQEDKKLKAAIKKFGV